MITRRIQALVVFAMVGHATAIGAIISDTFTTSNNTTLGGRPPAPENLPDGAWGIRTPWLSSASQYEIQSNAVVVSTGNAFIDVDDSGGYIKPKRLTINAKVQIGNINGGDLRLRGIGIGFFAQTPPTGNGEPDQLFQGVYLSYHGSVYVRTWDDVGPWTGQYGVTRISPVSGVEPNWNTRAYWSSDNADATGMPSPSNFGAFDHTATYTVRYDINTTTGDIGNISVINSQGGSIFYDMATSTFTDQNTDLAAFVSSSMFTDVTHMGTVDDFALSIPEPATMALIGLGLGLCILRRKPC